MVNARHLGIALLVQGLLFAGVGQAAVFSKDPNASRALSKIGALPTVVTVRQDTSGTAGLTGSTPVVFTWGSRIWQTTGNSPGTSLFTGVPVISNVIVGSFCNTVKTGSGGCNASQLGDTIGPFYGESGFVGTSVGAVPNPLGPGSLTGLIGYAQAVGEAKVVVAGGLGLTIPLDKLGKFNAETTTLKITGFGTILITFGPLHTDSIAITEITTNFISLPNRAPPVQGVPFTLDPATTEEVKTFMNTTWETIGGVHPTNPPITFATTWKDNFTFNQTWEGSTVNGATGVTINGTHSPGDLVPDAFLKQIHTLTHPGGGISPPSLSSGTGFVTVVTPLRIDTGDQLTNASGGVLRLKFAFVPEPGTLFLLVLGAAGLVFVGRHRLDR